MLVKLKRTWFAPSDPFKRDKSTTLSGRRFDKGVREIPDDLRDFLPSSAEILDDEAKKMDDVEKEVKEAAEAAKDLRAFDTERHSGFAEDAAKQELRERLAKARAAKAKKAAAKKKD